MSFFNFHFDFVPVCSGNGGGGGGGNNSSGTLPARHRLGFFRVA